VEAPAGIRKYYVGLAVVRPVQFDFGEVGEKFWNPVDRERQSKSYQIFKSGAQF